VLKSQSPRLHTLLLIADVTVGGAIYLWLGSHPRWGGPDFGQGVGWLGLGIVVALAWPLTLGHLDLYASQRRRDFASLATGFALAGLISTAILMATAFAFVRPASARFVLGVGVCQAVLLGGLRIGALAALRVARRFGRNYRNVVIVGTGPRAADVRRVIERHPEWGLRVVGYVDDQDVPIDPSIPSERVHKLVDVPQLMREKVVDEVIIAAPRSLMPALEPAVAACADAGVPFTMLTDIFGDYLPPPRITSFDALAALSFAPVHHSRAKLAIKRGVDVTGSALGLLLAAPVLGAAALAIRISSPGPVLFQQTRCGLNGRPFQILKLRTMCMDAETRLAEVLHLNEMDGPVFKLREDPRVTVVGRVLRRFSLDELPQLWNVLRGDMSLVGPRPPTPTEVAQYETSVRRRLSMRPGLTCLWQVSGRNEIQFDEWVKLDLSYIDTWSLSNDVRILVRTVPAVLSGTGH
jgi:exopolysaccharide biosynthesis polyprenyl glycosylphosphotransferase